MTLNEYQHFAARTIRADISQDDRLFHALHGIASEAGEIHGLFQKLYQGHPLDPEHEQKELGDLLWFIAEYCTARGWALNDICAMNIEKLYARYPQGFDPDRSLHRAQGDV